MMKMPIRHLENDLASLYHGSHKIAAVAVLTSEGPDLFLTLGPGDHTSQRWKLTPSLARKLRRELNERLD